MSARTPRSFATVSGAGENARELSVVQDDIHEKTVAQFRLAL